MKFLDRDSSAMMSLEKFMYNESYHGGEIVETMSVAEALERYGEVAQEATDARIGLVNDISLTTETWSVETTFEAAPPSNNTVLIGGIEHSYNFDTNTYEPVVVTPVAPNESSQDFDPTTDTVTLDNIDELGAGYADALTTTDFFMPDSKATQSQPVETAVSESNIIDIGGVSHQYNFDTGSYEPVASTVSEEDTRAEAISYAEDIRSSLAIPHEEWDKSGSLVYNSSAGVRPLSTEVSIEDQVPRYSDATPWNPESENLVKTMNFKEVRDALPQDIADRLKPKVIWKLLVRIGTHQPGINPKVHVDALRDGTLKFQLSPDEKALIFGLGGNGPEYLTKTLELEYGDLKPAPRPEMSQAKLIQTINKTYVSKPVDSRPMLEANVLGVPEAENSNELMASAAPSRKLSLPQDVLGLANLYLKDDLVLPEEAAKQVEKKMIQIARYLKLNNGQVLRDHGFMEMANGSLTTRIPLGGEPDLRRSMAESRNENLHDAGKQIKALAAEISSKYGVDILKGQLPKTTSWRERQAAKKKAFRTEQARIQSVVDRMNSLSGNDR